MVHFIGAGSGAADLITVRGQNLLKSADIVIYAGSLVNEELLSITKSDCKIYNSAYMTLEQITEIYIENRQKEIVRLHTGDPCLYGAIKEQMDILNENGIHYDICPGVSSFCGAAAALQMEYTLPNVSQTVIITRVEGKTPVPLNEDISKLAQHKATMVIFLSAGLLETLEQKLKQGGCRDDMPVAIVQKATWQDQKIVRCTVSTLSQCAKQNNITKTALIIVGDVLGSAYERSLLYHPAFSTEFRKAEQQ